MAMCFWQVVVGHMSDVTTATACISRDKFAEWGGESCRLESIDWCSVSFENVNTSFVGASKTQDVIKQIQYGGFSLQSKVSELIELCRY